MITTRRRQTMALHSNGVPRLLGSVRSPYFQLTNLREKAPSRDTNLSLYIMNFLIDAWGTAGGNPYAIISWWDNSNAFQTSDFVFMTIADVRNNGMKATVTAAINAYASNNSLTVSSIINLPVEVGAPVISDLSLSLQTSTGAVGTQVSSSNDAYVMVSGQVTTTATIAGNAAGDIILEVAPTNSSTAGDWVEQGRIGNSQALTLALTLQSVQIAKSQTVVFVPKGYYIKARQAGSGTVSYALGAVKKILV